MLPEEFVDCTLDDIRMRIASSIITYRGRPAFVGEYGPGDERRKHKLSLVSKDLGIEGTIVIGDDPRLDCANLGEHLGLMNTPVGIFYHTRLPRRQFCQGLNFSNTGIYFIQTPREGSKSKDPKFCPLTRPRDDPRRGMNGVPADIITTDHINFNRKYEEYAEMHGTYSHLIYLCMTQPALDMWENRYPSVKDIDKEGWTAVSRTLIMETSEEGRQFLWDMSDINNGACPVGEIIGGRVRYEPRREYLAQSVERNVGLQSI